MKNTIDQNAAKKHLEQTEELLTSSLNIIQGAMESGVQKEDAIKLLIDSYTQFLQKPGVADAMLSAESIRTCVAHLKSNLNGALEDNKH